MAKGYSNADLTDSMAGGRSDTRWGYGYKWMVHYLDDRYQHVIGMEGIEHWVPHFPDFAEHIHERIARDHVHIDAAYNVNHVDQGVAHIAPGTFRVAGFIDCMDYQISQPHAGPSGDYFGAMRKPNWYNIQHAFYQHHKKMHGVRVISICLPNGLTGGVWGPVSSRRHDVDIVHMAGLSPYLEHIQQAHYPEPYAFYGNAIFRVNERTIITRHEPAVNAPLTAEQEQENQMMNSMRVSIEWSYGLLKKIFHLGAELRDAFKLENGPNHMFAQVRVMHLLTNCHVCLHRSNISSRQTFNFAPPSLETYLNG